MTNQEEFVGIGCASVENVELPQSKGAFLTLDEGKPTRLRFLQGPVISYISQKWDEKERKPIGEKVKYDYNDPKAKEDKDARLVMTFLIYNYSLEMVQIWDIQVKELLETIKEINSIQPDMSAFDVQVTKTKKSNGFMGYKLVQGANKPFENAAVIKEVTEKGLKARLKKESEEPSILPEEDATIAEAEEAFK